MLTVQDAKECFELIECDRSHFDQFLRFPKRVTTLEALEEFTQVEIRCDLLNGEVRGMMVWGLLRREWDAKR